MNKILSGDRLVEKGTGRRGVALRNQWYERCQSLRGSRVIVRITRGANRGAKVNHFADQWEVLNQEIKKTTINRYAKQLERKNLRESGHSLTASSIAIAAGPYIVEIQEGCIVVRDGWREALQNKAGR